MIPIRIPWTEKPPIGTPLRTDGHWSVNGLVGAWLFNEYGGSLSNDVTAGSKNVITGAAFNVPGKLKFSGTAGNKVETGRIIQLGSGITCLAIFHKPATNSKNCPLLNDKVVANWTASDGFIFMVQANGIITAKAGNNQVTSVESAVNGKNNVIAWAFNATSNKLFLNGKETTYSTGNSGGSLVTSANTAKIGTYYDESDIRTGDNSIDLHLLYSYALSSSQISEISANPWVIAEPRTLWIPEAIAAGGFKPYWARHRTQILGGGLR